MKLSLTATEHAAGKIAAAFIRGNSPGDWLREIDAWQVDARSLTCYVLPESLQSISAAGLFVIFLEGKIPAAALIRQPYQALANKLFIPLHASLQPQTQTDELKRLLLWEVSVFHPTIGLVGFEFSDCLELPALLRFPPRTEKNWSCAIPGLPPSPKLNRISIAESSPEELIDALNNEIERKPLDEIKDKDEKSTPGSRLKDSLARGALKGGVLITKMLKGSPSGNSGGAGGGGSAGSDGSPGWFDRLDNWMHSKLDDLEKKRENELKRLLRLFDENSDEALKYALPLSSPYFNRGTSSPSSRLGKRDINFNLGLLGGRGAADYWDVGNYYSDLRTKYLNAARRETDAGNFKRAAYIYAQLLGDFSSAANVLVQGKFYRDASAIYQKHLNNKAAAAGCLENGGLLLEAIDLYIELGKAEKAGDLYRKLGQEEQALKQYEQCVAQSLSANDYLEAARITEDKVKAPAQAKELLLQGWTHASQAGSCLLRYFEKTAEDGQSLSREIRSIYTLRTPRTKRTELLHVLSRLARPAQDPEVAQTSRDIAYEIIGAQLAEGNAGNLQALANFVPGDTLITSDCDRYTHSNRKLLPKYSRPHAHQQLDTSVRWVTATAFRNQFLALGVKDNSLRLVRGNWQGQVEQLSWPCALKGDEQFTFSSDPRFSNRIILHCSRELLLEKKTFHETRSFDTPLVVESPAYLPKALLGFAIDKEDQLVTLSSPPGASVLTQYDANGKLIRITDCMLPDKTSQHIPPNEKASELISRNDHYYFFSGDALLRITETGVLEFIQLNAQIRQIAASTHYTLLKLIACTDRGCLLIRPDFKGLHVEGGFFAAEAEAGLICYLPDNGLVVAEKKKAYVYDISKEPLLRCMIETDTPIVAVLPAYTRNHCAVVEEGGRVLVYDVGVKGEASVTQ